MKRVLQVETRGIEIKYRGIKQTVFQEHRKTKGGYRWHTIATFNDKGEKVWFKGKCTLCGQDVLVAKVSNDHHISYEGDITIFLCYTCHTVEVRLSS